MSPPRPPATSLASIPGRRGVGGGEAAALAGDGCEVAGRDGGRLTGSDGVRLAGDPATLEDPDPLASKSRAASTGTEARPGSASRGIVPGAAGALGSCCGPSMSSFQFEASDCAPCAIGFAT